MNAKSTDVWQTVKKGSKRVTFSLKHSVYGPSAPSFVTKINRFANVQKNLAG